jgi:hypothetical protein
MPHPGQSTARAVSLAQAGAGIGFQICHKENTAINMEFSGSRKSAIGAFEGDGAGGGAHSPTTSASISGHTDLREVARYTKAADQARLARIAMETMRETFSAKSQT